MPGLSGELRQRLTQSQTLAPQMRQGLELLAMSLPELRQRLHEEMSRNPCIEDIEASLEKATVSEMVREMERDESVDESGSSEEDYEPEFGAAAAITRDEDADERRQRFFDRQTKEETLEEHLLAQLKMSDIDEKDLPLAEMLIGELNADGRFVGSIPDIVMVSGESEEKIVAVLKQIMQLDPPGCGARTPQECLLAQMDKLDGSPYQDDVRALIERHFEDMAEGRIAVIERDLGISHERYADVLRELRTLEPRPGRAYDLAGKSVSYVHPEVHAVKTDEGWEARVDDRIEKYTVLRAKMSVEKADVCVLMIDAEKGITDQDEHIAGLAHESGKPSVIVVNKWDLIEKDDNTAKEFTDKIRVALSYMSYAPILFVSAKTGQRTEKLFEFINYVYGQSNLRISTGMLNDVLNDAVTKVQPPSDKGRRLKIYYMTQIQVAPPTFVIFCNERELFHFSYQRYIENQLRTVFGFNGTPIKIIIRQKGDDPV